MLLFCHLHPWFPANPDPAQNVGVSSLVEQAGHLLFHAQPFVWQPGTNVTLLIAHSNALKISVSCMLSQLQLHSATTAKNKTRIIRVVLWLLPSWNYELNKLTLKKMAKCMGVRTVNAVLLYYETWRSESGGTFKMHSWPNTLSLWPRHFPKLIK